MDIESTDYPLKPGHIGVPNFSLALSLSKGWQVSTLRQAQGKSEV